MRFSFYDFTSPLSISEVDTLHKAPKGNEMMDKMVVCGGRQSFAVAGHGRAGPCSGWQWQCVAVQSIAGHGRGMQSTAVELQCSAVAVNFGSGSAVAAAAMAVAGRGSAGFAAEKGNSVNALPKWF